MEISTLACPNCANTQNLHINEVAQGYMIKCDYCGATSLARVEHDDDDDGYEIIERPKITPAPTYDPQKGEFGIQASWFLPVTAVVALLIYLIGWGYEDTEYWLSTASIVIWGVLLPLWLLLMALIWRPKWGEWLLGLAFAVPVFVFHVLAASIIDGRLNDDLVGIGAMYAGAALAGWLIGRGLHLVIKRSRAQGM
ncbi:MAG: hypothetical protein KDE51_07510 [Anaerolineales bacterium]|nr:hypothetical protein [Anaerolineales bacterium]